MQVRESHILVLFVQSLVEAEKKKDTFCAQGSKKISIFLLFTFNPAASCYYQLLLKKN